MFWSIADIKKIDAVYGCPGQEIIRQATGRFLRSFGHSGLKSRHFATLTVMENLLVASEMVLTIYEKWCFFTLQKSEPFFFKVYSRPSPTRESRWIYFFCDKTDYDLIKKFGPGIYDVCWIFLAFIILIEMQLRGI